MILKDDKRFPESARRKEKYNLGNIFHKIRNLDSYTRLRKEFLEMGIEFTFQPVKFEVFKEALLKYKELHGDCYVPNKYDTRNDQYSVEMRGSNLLYKYVDCIRTGHIYQDQKSKDELKAMGFDFYKISGVDFNAKKKM